MTSEIKLEVLSKLKKEFETLDKEHLWHLRFTLIRDESLKNEYEMEEAKKPENKFLNRYKDVNPYDHTRVVLMKDGYDYINASHVNISCVNRKYILTQGPLPQTISHFWLMVWEQASKGIVMLNNTLEKNQVKCSQYWPDELNQELILDDIGFKITFNGRDDFLYYAIYDLSIKNTATDEVRNITQFHYTTWPDFGVPHNPSIFLKFLQAVRRYGALDQDVGPLVIHCSAGIGRSGTFCLVDSYLELVNSGATDIPSVKDILLEMRKCRMGLIQTPDQLRFSYVAIIHGLKIDWNSQDEDIRIDGDELFPGAMYGNDSDSELPPLPPPRNQSLEFRKPLPGLPIEGSSSENDVETDSGKESDSKKNQLEEVSGVRKRKRFDSELEKAKHESEKFHEIMSHEAGRELKRRKRNTYTYGI